MSLCTELDYPCVTQNLEAYCDTVGEAGGSLCKAMTVGDLAYEQPISSMIDLISNNMECGVPLTEEQKTNAYNAYLKVTGLTEVDYEKIIKTVQNEFAYLFRFNSFYMFLPITILVTIIVWLMVIVGWITWPVGSFITTLVWIILYGASVAYRIHLTSMLRSRFKVLFDDASKAQKSRQDSVAYMPQALFAVASAITTPGSGPQWYCNPRD